MFSILFKSSSSHSILALIGRRRVHDAVAREGLCGHTANNVNCNLRAQNDISL